MRHSRSGKYFREVNRCPLLTAQEERSLASRIEAAQQLEEIERNYPPLRRAYPLSVCMVVDLLRRLRGNEPLVAVVAKAAGLPATESFVERLRDPKLLTAIDGEDPYKSSIKELSILIRLLPPQVAKIIGEKTTWDKVGSLISEPVDLRFLSQLQSIIPQLQTHFGKMAKGKIVEENLQLVKDEATQHVGHGLPLRDLIQEGSLGLIKAVNKFDCRKGYTFSVFATWWIRQEINRAIAEHHRATRVHVPKIKTKDQFYNLKRVLDDYYQREATFDEIASHMDITPEEVIEVMELSQASMSLEIPVGERKGRHEVESIPELISTSPDDVGRDPTARRLTELLSELADEERRVIELGYGLDGEGARTLQEMEEELNLTKGRIVRIAAGALLKLRTAAESR